MSDQKRPYRMKRRAESEAADPPADHRERGRAPRGARPGADHDQRDRRARRRPPVDRVPPLPRRGRAVRGVLVALAGRQPSARPERLGRDRRPGRAHRSRAERALRLLRAHAADVREPPARRAARSGPPPPAARLPRLPARGPGRPGGRPQPARPCRAPNARGDRPRAGIPDVALADARAAAERTTTRSRSCAGSSRLLPRPGHRTVDAGKHVGIAGANPLPFDPRPLSSVGRAPPW